MKRNAKHTLGIFMTAAMLYCLNGCSNDIDQTTEQEVTQKNEQTANVTGSQESEQITSIKDSPNEAPSGEDLDITVPDSADDDWYMKGNVYTDTDGNHLEVFFDDEGTIEFAVNGLSLYYTNINNFQFENDWRIYACDDGTTIIYYPGEPAHLEICDGDHAGVYTEGGDKVK